MFLKSLFFLLLMTIPLLQTPAQETPSLDPGVSRELARWRAAHFSDVRYKLDLTIEKMSPVLKGRIEISLRSTANQIILDWRKIRGKEEFTKVSNAQINGQSAKFDEINEHLVFKENVKAGENVIKLDFTSPIATSGAGVTRYVDKEDGAEYIYSLFVPSDASTAFPCFDQPDLKAKFKLNLFVAKEWKVVSNEIVESLIELECPAQGFCPNGYGFRETAPISTYVFAFAAGNFHEFKNNTSSVSSRFFVRESQTGKFEKESTEVFRLNSEAVKYLENYFDFKFPFSKYDLVLIPEFPFGGMEHAGATFLRESAIIFPTEPIANDYISRGNLIFHEAAHQWFGDTVTMRWFDDLWLKEGFAEFMAYKTLEKVLPQYNAWKAFYERNKPLAYQTDSTRGTTPIYQEIPNLSAAKSAYGNIVYRKAPSFLRQAEFYFGADKFQTAVRAFLKQNAFKNAEWQDLVKVLETITKQDLKTWANVWVTKRGMPIIRATKKPLAKPELSKVGADYPDVETLYLTQSNILGEGDAWKLKIKVLIGLDANSKSVFGRFDIDDGSSKNVFKTGSFIPKPKYVFPNYQDYGYGIFLLDENSRNYILANIQNENDAFLRAMMWGSLWDSVREAELNPKDYVELAIKNIAAEKDELTINTILNRVSIATNYYLSEAKTKEFASRLETVLLERIKQSETLGQRVTFYRSFLNLASTESGKQTLEDILSGKLQIQGLQLKTKDKFDLVTRLLILNDADAPKLLADLEKTETSDEAKRYAYAARAGIATKENKQKFFDDFINNKEISESYIENALAPFNSIKHAELTAPFLEKALRELPNLKRTRKIFFINNWLAAFVSGRKDEKALSVVNSYLSNNPDLDRDLHLKVLENVDLLERAIKIRTKFSD